MGLNPSPVSVAAGHYHQGRLGRAFWHRLASARILPVGTLPEAADDALVAAGHGITDLLKRPTAQMRERRRAGRPASGRFGRRPPIWRPAAVVFIYKRAACIGGRGGGPSPSLGASWTGVAPRAARAS